MLLLLLLLLLVGVVGLELVEFQADLVGYSQTHGMRFMISMFRQMRISAA